mmetsp:Transcript_16010/g.44665  ORF Transcript_16010/g.44665 Transcript_16010/m.44665 type:complete len:479 (+) Transcript_16010:222-1658(+)
MPVGLDTLRPRMVSLRVLNSLEALSHLLQLQSPQASGAASPPAWPRLQHLSCPSNAVSSMDSSLKLLPELCTLNLSRNQVTSISNIEACTRLTTLNLGCNNLVDCLPLAGCPSLENVALPWNAIASLEGLDALPRLRRLDVRGNRVRQLGEVALLAALPDLSELLLDRNPIACVKGWRISVLACFLETFTMLSLDDDEPSPHEQRRAAALMQQRAARKGFTTSHPQQFPRAHGKQPAIAGAQSTGPLPPPGDPAACPSASSSASSSFQPHQPMSSWTAGGTLSGLAADAEALGAMRHHRSRARVVDFDQEPQPKQASSFSLGPGAGETTMAPVAAKPTRGQPSRAASSPPASIVSNAGNSSLKSACWDAMQAFVDGQATGSISLEDELPASQSLLLPPSGSAASGGGKGSPSAAAALAARKQRLTSPPRFQQAMMERLRVSSSNGPSTSPPSLGDNHSIGTDSTSSLDVSEDSGEDDR